ncbi:MULTISPECIES: cyclic nucleotide-binding domain-containing protein [unclassified Oceanispirochaeta]|uniref:cyclic nucleotide-binding domain-containing protein n=1 Tax=unclassified Oceanispirochaeta TaxID=2635722 RepID=UPI000E095D79|nr:MULTISPECIES: cyclic nucleotide-binding domain-containing protein [unclassified Oceanispirochaeta]MBF9018610.1 cyclic nucleotide-binding domain-containing protein [Oceanispirochaeta sp. M2]NPD75031.1 cyclic nucleotide-binding domain-containing protein [Oceanispirochaeta sp. M1]RDG29104.1 cyclic nucleotide-binding domain-containing protein [Oceanispirochaeta sp. M1]
MSTQDNSFKKMTQHISPGETIFKEGELGNVMYVIMDGDIEIRKKTGKASYKTLIVLKKGDFFGEMAIIERKPRTASAVARTQCKLIMLDTDAFYAMVEKSSDFAVKMIKTLSSRLRKADHLIEYLLGSNDEKQVVMGLASFVKSHPDSDTGSGEYKIDLREFLRWSSQNLGYPDHTVQEAIKRLIARKVVKVNDSSGKISSIFLAHNLMARL